MKEKQAPGVLLKCKFHRFGTFDLLITASMPRETSMSREIRRVTSIARTGDAWYSRLKAEGIRHTKQNCNPLQEMVTSIHGEMNRLARETGEKPDFKAVFDQMDDDKGGELSMDEFVEGLSRLG